MVAALDEAAATLLSVWEEARERTTHQLPTAQLRAVMLVEQHDGINLRRLATLLGTLLSSASRLCDRLVAAGMLEREPGRYDRREISLHLTPEAVRLLAELRADRQARLAEVLAGMSPAGREALRRGLAELREAARRSSPPERRHTPPDQRRSPPDRHHPSAGQDESATGPCRTYESAARATPCDAPAGTGRRPAASTCRCPATGAAPTRADSGAA